MVEDTGILTKVDKVSQKRLERCREYLEKGLVLVNAFTGDIVKHNCDGLCSHETCSKIYTKYTKVKINGIKLFIGFCDEHADEFMEFEE